MAHLLPDVVVFATTLVTLIFSGILVAGLMKDAKERQTKTLKRSKEETPEGEAECVTASSENAARGIYTNMYMYVYQMDIQSFIYVLFYCVCEVLIATLHAQISAIFWIHIQ